MRGEESWEFWWQKTKQLLGDKPWGVGVLGFVPQELRQKLIRRHQPP